MSECGVLDLNRRAPDHLSRPPRPLWTVARCSHNVPKMSTPLASLTLTGDPLIVTCSYCALTRVLEPLAALVAFGDAATFEDVEAQPCPRCGIKNDRARWQRAKAATTEDLFQAAHPGAHLVKNGRRPRRRSASRWAE